MTPEIGSGATHKRKGKSDNPKYPLPKKECLLNLGTGDMVVVKVIDYFDDDDGVEHVIASHGPLTVVRPSDRIISS